VAGRLTDKVGARPLTVTGMALVTGALGVVALAHPGEALLVGALALVGVGLGLFTPSNNAAIMSAAPKSESGVASGILNMTRGMGTALGLAVTGLLYGLASGPTAGFQLSSLLLAGVAGAAALTSSLRPAAAPRELASLGQGRA